MDISAICGSTHLELVLAGLSGGAGVEEVDCENLHDIKSVLALSDMMTAGLNALETIGVSIVALLMSVVCLPSSDVFATRTRTCPPAHHQVPCLRAIVPSWRFDLLSWLKVLYFDRSIDGWKMVLLLNFAGRRFLQREERARWKARKEPLCGCLCLYAKTPLAPNLAIAFCVASYSSLLYLPSTF